MIDKQVAEFSDSFIWDCTSATPRVAAKLDDGFDFPPAVHPGRDLSTAALLVLSLITSAVWGGWKLLVAG
jgi:hypothetical protein